MATVDELRDLAGQFLAQDRPQLGSIQICRDYVEELVSVIDNNDELPQDRLRYLYNAKMSLHRRINHRFLTKLLAETLFEVELLTHYSLDLLKSDDRFVETNPPLEFRLDWRELCQSINHDQPIYLTQLGTKEWILSRFENTTHSENRVQ